MASLTSENARTRIRQLAEVYAKHGGDYRRQPVKWDSQKWSNHVDPDWNLPHPLTRGDVLALVEAVRTYPDAAEKAFTAIMVWGYGTTGYGPHRVKAMKQDRPEGIGHYMLDVVKAAGEGRLEAYRFIANNSITQLGPSYASKVAYFATPGEQSPILDNLVAGWVKTQQNSRTFNARQWSTAQYATFLEYCQELLDVVAPVVSDGHATCGLVEYLMFIDQSTSFVPAWAKTI
jgi:hypothetical protein